MSLTVVVFGILFVVGVIREANGRNRSRRRPGYFDDEGFALGLGLREEFRYGTHDD